MMLLTTDWIVLLKLDGRKEEEDCGDSLLLFLGEATDPLFTLPFSRCWRGSGLTGSDPRCPPKSVGDMRDGPRLIGVSCDRDPFWVSPNPLFKSLLSKLFCKRSRCSTLGAEFIRLCKPDVPGRGSPAAKRCLRCCSLRSATSCSLFWRSIRRLRKSTSSRVWSGSSFISMCLSK